jgi:hypothetical protein
MAARNSRETSVTVTRGKYSGVLSILQYNWHFYAASLCVLFGIGGCYGSGSYRAMGKQS